MNLDYLGKALTVVFTAASGCYAAIQAGRSWRSQAIERRRTDQQRRAEELRRLVLERERHQETLDLVFDYKTARDRHLRVDNLFFSPEERATRARVDGAFEHFRMVHASVKLGLITAEDLSPWTYWIHRTGLRPALARYSEACGYAVFMRELAAWTEGSEELALLREKCTWWTYEEPGGVPATPGEA